MTSQSSVSAGPASEPPTTGKESASEIALSGVSGSVADSEGVSSELALNTSARPPWSLARALDFGTSKAWAAPVACPMLSNATLGQCMGGKLTLSLESCQYERLDKSFAKAVWSGSKVLDFGASCPARILDITSMTRTVGDNTTRTAADGVVLSIDTTTPSGYDSVISPQPSGGAAITRSTGSRAIDIKGIHYVARKSASATARLWDHTLSTSTPIQVTLEKDGTRRVSGTVVVQHNLLKYTAHAELSDVVFDFAKCGCLPVSGTVTTTLSGSVTGTETLDIMGCARGSYIDPKGAKSPLTLSRCL